MRNAKVILIAGPTASGKSALALELAEKLGGSIVNADSMQVYRDLRVITARPTRGGRSARAASALRPCRRGENYSVGRWLRDVGAALDEIAAQGRVAILVGGTGLYFKALTSGLAAVPPIPAEIRAQVRARVQSEGVAPLYAELVERDAATAHRADAERPLAHLRARWKWCWRPGARSPTGIARVCRRWSSRRGRRKSSSPASARNWWRASRRALPPCSQPARSSEVRALRRAQARSAAAGDEGARRALADPPSQRRDHRSDEAAAGAVMDTRRYAKRQLTWFRNQMGDWPWAPAAEGQKALESQLAGVRPAD